MLYSTAWKLIWLRGGMVKLSWLTSLICVRDWCVIHQADEVNSAEVHRILEGLLMMRTRWGGLSSSGSVGGMLQKAWIVGGARMVDTGICFSAIARSLISAKTISRSYVCDKVAEQPFTSWWCLTEVRRWWFHEILCADWCRTADTKVSFCCGSLFFLLNLVCLRCLLMSLLLLLIRDLWLIHDGMWDVTMLTVWKDEWNRCADGNVAHELEKEVENAKDLYITI